MVVVMLGSTLFWKKGAIFGQFGTHLGWFFDDFLGLRVWSIWGILQKSDKVEKVSCIFSFLEAKMDPKVDQKRARSRKSASGGGVGSDFYRCLLPSLFGVTPRTDSWRV